MNSGSQRLLEILLREFIEELKAADECACNECLGWKVCAFLEKKPTKKKGRPGK